MLGLFVLDSNQCKASKAGMISAVLALIYRGLVGFALWHFAASHNGLTGGPVLAIQCCAKQSGGCGMPDLDRWRYVGPKRLYE